MDSARTAAAPQSVLCIEDHPLNMALVEILLEGLPGVRLLKAFTGREGVRLAKAELPDLVLLDMRLPDISGLEVVRELSELVSQGLLRVVLLTGESFSMDVVKAMSLGAHDYWPKPLTAERVRDGVTRALAEMAARRARLDGGSRSGA
jgi:CheY-like chemotaxis protein